MKLGGWWRIWIVFTVLYSAAVLAIGVATWPDMADIRYGRWSAVRLSPASEALLAAGSAPEVAAVRLEAPNRQEFRLPADTPDAQIRAFARDVDRMLEAELALRRASMRTVLIVMLGVPPAVLLVLGLAIAWIRRGFAGLRAGPP